MAKVVNDFSIGKYRVLKLDSEIPNTAYNHFLIDGKEYKPVPIYDTVNCIAVESSDIFIGKQVIFV